MDSLVSARGADHQMPTTFLHWHYLHVTGSAQCSWSCQCEFFRTPHTTSPKHNELLGYEVCVRMHNARKVHNTVCNAYFIPADDSPGIQCSPARSKVIAAPALVNNAATTQCTAHTCN